MLRGASPKWSRASSTLSGASSMWIAACQGGETRASEALRPSKTRSWEGDGRK